MALAPITSTMSQVTLSEAQADLNTAQADLDTAQVSLTRAQASTDDATIATAQARVTSASAAVVVAATYTQLAAEPVWGAQFVPPVMNAGLIGPLRVFYGLSFNAVGSAGDNNHLYGRHRSYNWDALSQYCINRSYGTSDARDQGGSRDWYRAVDVGITGQQLFDASHRMDALARSGACPGLAEWFGTFDGVNVVGWFQGAPGTSDSSHLFHLHVGVWNQYANDAATMQQIYGAITGTSTPTPTPGHRKATGMFRMIDPEGGQFVISPDTLSSTGWSFVEITPDQQGWPLVAAGIGTANGNQNDPNHDPHSSGGGALDWRPGMFGPAKAAVRQQLIQDIAIAVVAELPVGSGTLTAAQVAEAVADKVAQRLGN